MVIGARNKALARKAAEESARLAADSLADSIAPPAEEFKTPAKKAVKKKKKTK